MIAEFDWWLLIVGLVLGAGLTWLVVSESRREDGDLDERERASEIAWIVARLKRAYPRLTVAQVESVLAEHRAYLAAPPPDPDPASEPAPDPSPGEPSEGAAEAPASDSERAEEDRIVG